MPITSKRFERRRQSRRNNAQQGVVAHRNHQPPRNTCRRSASQRQSEMVDNDIESGHPSCGRRQYGIAEPLGKDPPTAKHGGHGDLRAADRRRGDNIGYEPAGRHSRNTGKPRPCFRAEKHARGRSRNGAASAAMERPQRAPTFSRPTGSSNLRQRPSSETRHKSGHRVYLGWHLTSAIAAAAVSLLLIDS
jgi:hypothetical protein